MLAEAMNMALSNDIYSGIDVPPFDNSSMDGYAFAFNPKIQAYNIVQNIQAGDFSNHILKCNEAARILTGAPLPAGSDTVIQQELTSVNNGTVSFNISQLQQGINVRLKGSQNKKGEIIAFAGEVVTPGMVGLLASVGVQKIFVHTPPSVGVIITGNELQNIGDDLKAGHIYNSNEPILTTYLRLLGIKEIECIHVKDKKSLLKDKVKLFLTKYDVLVSTGGISVGDYDFVHEVLLSEDVKPLFYKVKQKPGKPLFVGKKNSKWIFALPGNPASVLACFNQYVKPCLLGMMGYKNTFAPDAVMPVANKFQKDNKLTHILKAKRDFKSVQILSGQDSFNLLPFNNANCFVVIDEAIEFLSAGTLVSVYNI